ncbi:GerMN domain-containing protein [Clostridium formicaceticum]|nr:GerMN domain-containing protein [Clostridium formicaceticum]ARE85943.1 Sporulation and spore germination [Clostridium formicaceticum]
MKKTGLILLVIAMMLTFVGCNRTPKETPVPPIEAENPPQGEGTDTVVDPAPEGEITRVTLYFVNDEYVATGDERLEKVLPVEKEVTVGEKSVEAMILAELQQVPEDDALSTTLEGIKVLSVDTAEGVAYVNIAGERLSGGSLQETLVIHQIVYSLTGLEEIEAVQFLVDGSKRETLMGHILIEEPLKREDIRF